MTPLMISAQFAAFVWFTSRPANAGKGNDEAMRFARENWEYFLPVAHRGLGRLLMKMATASTPRAPKLAPVACAAPLTAAATASPLPAGPVGPPFSRN